jgi:hypothetical protein
VDLPLVLSLLLAAGAAVFAAIFRLAAAGHILAAAIRREDGRRADKQRDYQTEHYDYFLHFNSPFLKSEILGRI